DGGGLYGTEDAVNFVVRQGEVTRVDGPYAEAKEVFVGRAVLQYDTREEPVADQQEFAALHAKHWPEVTVISTLRQISTGPEEPGASTGLTTLAPGRAGPLMTWPRPSSPRGGPSRPASSVLSRG